MSECTKPIINFVHIPKTAGTSFRVAAEQFWGAQNVVNDYGADSPDTSGVCQKHCYGELADHWAFVSECRERGTKMISGHIHAEKYLPAVSVLNTVTFVRDPVQRLISEYEHFVRRKKYKGSFESFYNLSGMRNRYSKLLQRVPIRAIGFVGLTEQYESSLKMINSMVAGDIRPLEKNLGKKSVQAVHAVSDEDKAEIRRLNAPDFRLYAEAVELFEIRLELFDRGLPFVYGRAVHKGKRQVAGWAWSHPEKPEKIIICVNGEVAGQSLACEYRPDLCRLGVPRAGYVGWSVAVNLNQNDRVECRVAATGQVLDSFVFSDV